MGAAMRRFSERIEAERKATVTPLTPTQRGVFLCPPNDHCPVCKNKAVRFVQYHGNGCLLDMSNDISIEYECLYHLCRKHWVCVYKLANVYAC